MYMCVFVGVFVGVFVYVGIGVWVHACVCVRVWDVFINKHTNNQYCKHNVNINQGYI